MVFVDFRHITGKRAFEWEGIQLKDILYAVRMIGRSGAGAAAAFAIMGGQIAVVAAGSFTLKREAVTLRCGAPHISAKAWRDRRLRRHPLRSGWRAGQKRRQVRRELVGRKFLRSRIPVRGRDAMLCHRIISLSRNHQIPKDFLATVFS